MSSWYLGTIGFSYKEWVGGFYPIGTSPREYLPYYCKIFNSVEIDTTFHSIPHSSNVQSWLANVPENFIFCFKTPRIITHELGLLGSEGLMNEFLDAIGPIREKTGPILIQLPPSYTQENSSILEQFLENLPPLFRYAIEFRHPSWYIENTKQLLARHQAGWVSIDFPKLPRHIYQTTDFLYIRWIGINGMYHRHSYERVDKTNELRQWIENIKPIVESVPNIYGYFNNDYAGFAAGSCKRFMQLVGLPTNDPHHPYQERLF
jgi:uncharacterized protein YecE (DUF72 family)